MMLDINNISSNKKVLVLAPHTDDAEFGCGGTLHKLINNGFQVFQVAFSSAAKIQEHGLRNQILEKEIIRASFEIGLKKENLFIHDFDVREFWSNRQKILDLILYYKSKINPDIVFVPCSFDVHQDHKVIYEEALRAFKHQTLFGYELPWNCYQFNYQLFIHLNSEDILAKKNAIKCYQSQKSRIYADENWIESLAQTRGVQANTKYAETFECIRINFK